MSIRRHARRGLDHRLTTLASAMSVTAFLSVSAFGCARTPGTKALPSPDSLARLRVLSTFTFKATIDSLRASTVAEVPASPHTIAVTPFASLQCPHAVGFFGGVRNEMTVFTRDTAGLAPKQIWWFFGAGWVIGSGLAVREIARVPADYADSILQRQFLGPTGPRQIVERHLQDTTSFVIGTLALDSIRPRLAAMSDVRTLGLSVPLSVTSVLFAPGNIRPGSTVNVAVQAAFIMQWPLLRVPDAYQHLLFFLHPTIGIPGDVVKDGPKPPYMLRATEDVNPATDSAFVASIVRSQPTPVFGARSPDFVPHCGGVAR